MSAPKWERDAFEDGSGCWWRYRSSLGWELTIDESDGAGFQAWWIPHHAGTDDLMIGPVRKTRKAALNDCKRYAKALRAELVKFGRVKL